MPKVTKQVVRSVAAVATGGVSELGRFAGSKIGGAIGGESGALIGAVTAGVIGGSGGGPASGGVSAVPGAAFKAAATVASMDPPKPAGAVALPGEDPTLQAEREQAAIDNTKLEERRRRQLLARQGDLVKTSPLGAAIKQNKLGGPSLTGY